MVNAIETPRLTTQEFEKVASIIYAQCGIKLEACKKIMVEARLNKRLRVLNYSSFDKYIQFVSSSDGLEQEMVHMIDVVTTNKTDFFREAHHFDFLRTEILPEFESNGQPFKVWSSACSSGEEPYTLAMVLQEFERLNPDFSYKIWASDISTNVLQKAVDAIYPMDRAIDIPIEFKRKYLLKSKDATNPRVRIIPELREKVKFLRLNLTDAELEIEGNMDVIFCRNVLIYFDRQTQYKVIQSLIKKLKPGGILLIGHSESLHFFDLPLKQIRPTIFVKK